MTIITNVEDLRQQARKKLPKSLFDYMDGGSYTEQTLARNASDFDELFFKQRVMVDVSDKSLSKTLMGREYALPIGIAPTGLAGLYHPDGEIVALNAAADWNLPYALSTVSICSMEQLRQSNPYPYWFQLYIMKDRAFTETLVHRAAAADCSALVLTVDLPTSGQRHKDIKNGLSVPFRLSGSNILNTLSKPGWLYRMSKTPNRTFGNLQEILAQAKGNITGLAQWCASQYDDSINWDDVRWIRGLWKGKLIIKGILTPEDAQKAIDCGCDAIIVSNHGGRQLDGVRSTISSLPRIAQTVNKQTEVILDGGIRSGQDVIKALAQGADFCLIGRPYLYGLSCGGRAGLDKLFTILKSELATSMTLMGLKDVNDIDAHCLDNPLRFSQTP